MPYVCGKCYKTKGGVGGRKHRGHAAGGKKHKTRYQICMGKQLRSKTNRTTDPQMRMKLASNYCSRLKKK